ncbi:nucleoside triphosphate pyrophosphohydrolase [Beijerinckia sp. L45]|uniref:nucleoside triphosphate pyrophosphohydrolase n=1 Tax=Beijerinckia sp. L45 TaxID=1641855 RepID=UPI00131CCF9A|nr:nucleoside triphosphate pyrophosphohydrolase [Beijerinckia sp. L45]
MPPALQRLIDIMAALRTPESGCPWDLAQTSATIAPYCIEEAYEVVDAIERGDVEDLRDELGDLLLQVVFHARIAEETGQFAFADVAEAVCAKMIRRHPHVFGDLKSASPDGVRANWETIKAEERQLKRDKAGPRRDRAGLLADVPVALPGLTRALKLQQKASRVGFDWGDVRLVLAKIREEIDEIEEAVASKDANEVAGEIGDLLFAVTNLARHAAVDPETAVRSTNAKFERRFAFIERELATRGSSAEAASLDDMDALWDEAKRQGL